MASSDVEHRFRIVVRERRIGFGEAVVRAGGIGLASALSFWVDDVVLSAMGASHDDVLLGGMWAAAATVFVLHDRFHDAWRSLWVRIGATVLSCLLCLVYLLVLPFSAWGLAAVLGAGALVCYLTGHPEQLVTTGITTSVVLVVAALGDGADAWRQPPLRVLDTLIGLAVGIAAARILEPALARLVTAGETDEHEPR